MLSIYLGLFLLAAATFVFEISLTRIFSLAQFYHFAFMAVSLALLGFGASGSLLTLWPRLAGSHWRHRLAWLAAAFGLSIPASYLLTNALPFDSYSIAWDPRQALYLLLYYLALVVPFALSGLAVSIPLAAAPTGAHRIYGANMAGSAAGCLLAVLLLPRLGGPGTVAAAGLLGWLATAAFAWRGVVGAGLEPGRAGFKPAPTLGYLAGTALLAWLTVARPPFLDVRLSPYKGLSQALLYPGARVIFSDWNAFSRVDLLQSPGVRQLPGLSYTYTAAPPPQLGLTVDGDDLTAVPLIANPQADLAFSDYLPAAIAYRLRPGARALILEPKGGLDVWAALAEGAAAVTAVESNPLLITAARYGMSPPAADVYGDPRVRVVSEVGRSYLRRSAERFDVVQLALTQPYRPVTSGAYSLAEDYLHTVEAFSDYLAHLEEDGLLVVTRWLQTPPSETVRTLALIVEALEEAGVADPAAGIIAFRGVQTGTLLAKKGGFTAAEMDAVREFCTARRFDLVVGPGVRPEETNRYNVLPEPYYVQAFGELLASDDRRAFYAAYPFAVAPPTDDHPFFFHFFRWQQTPAILRTLGKTWQPFGGSGYFVLLALLALAVLASVVLILGPLLLKGTAGTQGKWGELRGRAFLYFGLLGLAYLFVEIPLMQRFILFLGQPVYAMTAVLFALLLFSGLGSLCAPRLPHRLTLGGLTVAIILYPLLLPYLFRLTLGLPLFGRFGIAVLTLAPLGFLMGVPFPRGIGLLERRTPRLIPWAWAVNGCTSVLSSILAALGALSWGFSAVLGAGAACYAGAMLSIWTVAREQRPSY
ncbi:MAG: hypothetical protein QHJ81_00380 [Anaerolineae bacterium]|nr:hypothetical protein [Anaerolineae bacterium]